MFGGFYGGAGGCGGWNGWGPGWGGWNGGWNGNFWGGPCNKCGHCCLCNRSNNLTTLGLAAMFYSFNYGRPWLDGAGRFDGGGPFFKGDGFFGRGERREERKERVCEDVRTGRGGYKYL